MGIGNTNSCQHNHREYMDDYGQAFYCKDCRTLVPCKYEQSDYDKGYAAGYAAAKAEMLGKLNEFNPRYVEGGRVPEDAIEHRNAPKFRDTIEKKGQ